MTAQEHSPLVTVVSIFLDEREFLSEAIESVIAQDFKDWELVLVDDGSRDGSDAIAQAFAASDSRIRLIAHEGGANLGMSASRNAGVAAGSGRFVTFIDGDDRWPPDKLSRQLAIMDANPGIGAAVGAFRIWDSWRGGEDRIEYSGQSRDCVTPVPDALLQVYPLGRAGGAPVSAMVRRSLFEDIGGFEESFPGFYEDQAFFLKVYAHAPVWFSSEVWQDYRQHPGSCCARVEAAGTYGRKRAAFLHWAERYVRALGREWEGEVLAAIRRERRRLRFREWARPVRKGLAAIRRTVTFGGRRASGEGSLQPSGNGS